MQEQGLYGTVTEIEHAGAQLERPNGGAVAKLERPNCGLTRRAVGRLAQGRDHPVLTYVPGLSDARAGIVWHGDGD
jgi:hypothetical protein